MTDPLPSDEAVEAAWREAHEASRDYIAQPTVRAALTAAYRIDMPRREAEVRAATLREVAMRECTGARDCPATEHLHGCFLAPFNPEAEPKRPRNHAPWCCVEHEGPCDFNQETE